MIDDELYIRLEDGSYKNSEYKTPPEFIGIKATRVIEFANFISPEIGRYFRDFIEINDKFMKGMIKLFCLKTLAVE